MDELTDAKSVIEELGGLNAVASLTGRKYNAVWNWQNVGTFPSSTYRVITEALYLRGKTAPASLWRMIAAEAS
jgi:hypothetical protein